MITIGTMAKAAAIGMSPAVPWNWIDRLADEGPRRADQLRDDVIAQGEREGEDRAGGDARDRGGRITLRKVSPGLAPRSLRRFDERAAAHVRGPPGSAAP